MMPVPKFFIIAGEPSGDRLGAALMAGLKELSPSVEFAGIGGPLMQAQGLQSLFPMEELSIMGIVEVLPKLPHLLRRVQQSADAAVAFDPTALITIDSPDFCLRVSRKVKAVSDIPVVHYVAPSVWAWRPERAVKMARSVDHVLTLLPFEPPLMQAAGMSADFVGHPVVAEPRADAQAVAGFRAAYGIDPDQPVLTVLPGSRSGEVARMGPVFRDVVLRLGTEMPGVRVVIPSVANRVEELQQIFAGSGAIILDPRGRPPEETEAEKRACYAGSAAALATSGTVSLELAANDVPMVIAYDMNPITGYLTRRMALVSTVTLVNIVTDTRAVPEFLFRDCNADTIYPVIHRLLSDPQAGAEQHDAMRATMQALGQGGEPPGLRAARSVMAFVK